MIYHHLHRPFCNNQQDEMLESNSTFSYKLNNKFRHRNIIGCSTLPTVFHIQISVAEETDFRLIRRKEKDVIFSLLCHRKDGVISAREKLAVCDVTYLPYMDIN